jgi:hypothetical protein
MGKEEKEGKENSRVEVILGFEGGTVTAQKGPSVSIFPKKWALPLFYFLLYLRIPTCRAKAGYPSS